MNDKIIVDRGQLYLANNMNSEIKDINSLKIIENGDCFFFTVTDDNFKDINNESNNSFTYSKEIYIPLDDFTSISDTNPNSEDIIDYKLGIPIKDYNIVTPKNSKKLLFEASKKKGRPKLSGNKKEHDKHCLDNILVKIQVHFLSFIINLSNDALKAQFGEKTTYNFKHLSHGIKKEINFNSFYKNKNCIIKDILKKDISSKYKKCKDPKINEKILKEACEKSFWLDNFFNLKYIKVFKEYYNINEPLTKIEYKGKTFKLSNKPKSLYSLLEKNDTQREEINNTIKPVYLNIKTGYCGQDPFTLKKAKID